MKVTQEQQNKGQELYQELVQRSWEDASFKERLIANPNATIAEVTGNETSDQNIVVEDQTDAKTIYINIPARVDVDQLELTDEQLETVAGGVTPASGFWFAGGLALGVISRLV